jgi:glycosyltransferase involved in cell wall biosynthesis
MRPFTLSVVVPCLNEGPNIAPVYQEIVAELSRYDALEIMFVDDGSTDDTLLAVRELAIRDDRVSYLSFTRNFGLEAAFSAGYRYARHDWILHLDADLQFPPAEAHHLVVAAQAGYDAVFGVRVARKDRWLRRFSSGVTDFIARRLLRIEIPPGATSFRLVRATLAQRVVTLDLGTPYFLANVPRLTSAWTTVPTVHRARARGEPKVTFRGLAKHAVGLFISYSDRPMAAVVGASFAAMAICLAGAVCAAFRAFAAALALYGVAAALGLFAFAVTARYLVHISRGQDNRPRYLIKEANVPVDEDDLLAPDLAGAAR